MAQAQTDFNLQPVVDMVGERFLTGASLLLRGRIGEGLAHTVLGMVAYTTFGLPAMLLVSANSFARAETGHNLIELATHALPHNEPATGAKKA
jgi:hypothetical protein